MADAADRPIADVTELVDKNGLCKLFTNRVRARILVTLFYADEPLSEAEIAGGAGVDQTVVIEALDPLGRFDVLEEHSEGEETRYELEEDDELVEALRALAELATDRYYDSFE